MVKLVRYGNSGAEKPGAIDSQGRLRDLSAHLADIDPAALGDGAQLASLPIEDCPLVEEPVRLGPPVARPGKFIGIGLNYSDHAEEAGMPIPEEPIVFMKATSSIAGPNDALRLPPAARKADWEVELGVVIGRAARNVTPEAALSHVAGYLVVNDISERAWQLEHGGQWTKGKSHAGFGPIGPWLVTADEIADPQSLDLWLKLNGEVMQTGHTGRMIFTVAELIADLSRYMTLEPGDIITTGTPPGVGMGRDPQRFLRPGDVMELGIDGLGSQRITVEAAGEE